MLKTFHSLVALTPLVLFSAGCGGSQGPATPTAPTAPAPAPTATVTASQSGGLQGASSISFSAQTTNFEAGALNYRWEFGDGETSAESTVAHIYNSAGTYTVSVTVSNARQSARSEIAVAIYGLTGRWKSVSNRITLDLTQTGKSITGRAAWENGPGAPSYSQCVISGSAEAGEGGIVLTQPPCAHSTFSPMAAYNYRLGMVVGGQQLAGTITAPAVAGSTGGVLLNRE